MADCERRRISSGIIFPLFLVGLGVVFLLDQMDIAPAHRILEYFWPAVLIYFGLAGLLFHAFIGRFWGVMLTLLGGLMLLHQLGYHVNVNLFWPIALIVWGLWLLGFALMGDPKWKTKWAGSFADQVGHRISFDSTTPDLEQVAIFSAIRRRIVSQNFEGGKTVGVFGEVKLDLTEAELAGDVVEMEASGVFGAVEIRVPEKWIVSVRGAAVLGEYQDRTRQQPQGNPPKKLIIRGAAVFGSVVVRN
jgi:predicted membrane protein